MVANPPSYLTARLAVEALRNGVPNREAVRELGCNQPRAEQRFVDMLEGTADAQNRPGAAPGMLVSGDFGAGKSHLLEHLKHLALSRNFVCSRVAISKETPLYHLGKVFSSAMESGRIPDRAGRFIEELSLAIEQKSARYEAFSRWAEEAASNGLLSPIFPASLRVYERSDDFELNGDIESFWAGDRIQVAKLRAGLRQIGEARTYRFRAPKAADLPPQRLRFAVELIKGVGYRGWVVLLDEIELMGSYSILQRGRSYAEVARWMGLAQGESYPGLIVIGAVTEDFAAAIISPDGQKKDRDYVRPRLEQNARYAALGARAESGMRLLEQGCVALDPPSDDGVRATMETLRRLYRRAYDWEPPVHQATAGGAGFQGRMRYKVRTAINEWDLRRLHATYQPHTEIEQFATPYVENADLEHEARDDPA